ncbi:MAG: hypothetical protein N2037_00735 [Acidimicrobiales bacterium]|nr:hypothetical protein [Acidimicrobiales bacterium]
MFMTTPLRCVLAITAVVLLITASACSNSTEDQQLPVTGSNGTTKTTGATGTTGTTQEQTDGASASSAIVFNGQGNDLDAYTALPPFTHQKVITNRAADPNGLDINAQICFFPDGSRRFVAGEDTGQGNGITQGWGIFQLDGSEVGELEATQIGKLVPTYQSAADNAENYGCGFLSDGRILTTDIGDQALGPANGQLIVWFPPFDSHEVRYCKLDVDIATAQSIWVSSKDEVYVASARPTDEPGATGAGVWRYTGPFPTSPDAAGGCGKADATGAPLADTVNKSLVIKAGEHGLLSPSGLAPAPNGNLYVSSVASGVIAEFRTDGTFVRTILEPPGPAAESGPLYPTGTPLGLAVGPDGSLYYADIGLVRGGPGGFGPGPKTGTLRRIAFINGEPQPPEVMARDLAFPDGVGVLVP